MGTYIEHVQSVAAVHQAAAAEARAAKAQVWRDRMTPLETRVTKLLTTIPSEIQNQGLALTTLRSMLAGKWRGKCHPGELGQALRKLGFKRRRNWSKATSSFNALWFPVSAEK
jgi:hypothetical protein